MRRVAWLAGVVSLVGTLTYVFVYLHRWEWHRAILVGVLFIATEVAMGVAFLSHRLTMIERRLGDQARPAAAPVRSRLVEAAPERRPFAWLDPKAGRTDVFIPILLGSGAVVSAAAWVVERLAEKTTEPAQITQLERDLAPLALPDGLVVVDDERHAEARAPMGDAAALLVRPASPR